MMNTCLAPAFVDGSSALDIAIDLPERKEARIISFPGCTNLGNGKDDCTVKIVGNRVKRGLLKMAQSSEMLCSLKFEDFKGCAYEAFTKRGVAALSIGSAAIACVSLAMGA